MPVHPLAAALAISVAVLAASPRANASPTDPFENCQTQTGRNASVLVKARSAFHLVNASGRSESLTPDDELAAFTPEGLCAGTLVWKGRTAMLSLWEDDPLTPDKDGFAPGDPLSLRVWDASSQSVLVSLYLRYQAPFDTSGHYTTDAIFAPGSAFFGPPPFVAVEASAARASNASQKSASVMPPEDYTLAPNYPNPFRSSTTIRYGLPEEAAMRLDVYDALGRRVTTLVNEGQQPGWYEVELRASTLAAGLYIVRLRANDFVSDRRMMLVR